MMKIKNAVKIFKALGNETRLKILEIMYSGETRMCEIIKKTHKTQPTVSNHISKLHSLDLVSLKKEGTKSRYEITNEDLKKILAIIFEKK